MGKHSSKLTGPREPATGCAHIGQHGRCGMDAPFSQNGTGAGPWYCVTHMFGNAAAHTNAASLSANMRRSFWRANPGLQRYVEQESFVVTGYSRALLDKLSRHGYERAPMYEREPGEDAA